MTERSGAPGEHRQLVQSWIVKKVHTLAARDPTLFVRDVFSSPSIGPISAWLVVALITLVAWLTVRYAPGAVERADSVAGTGDAGIISESTGYWTLGIVASITLMASLQPILTRGVNYVWAEQISEWYTRRGILLRAPLGLACCISASIYYLPSWLLSTVDYLLARPVALLAGAGLPSAQLRYAILLIWMTASLAATWLSIAPFGLFSAAWGAALIIGVVRRWNWVEADREAFLISRKRDMQIERVGFAEDLRDEAMIGLLFLFALMPLALRQVALAWPDTFLISGGVGEASTTHAWFGFFGAELAKSVPFVDWSEVFHVANGSPIEPNTTLGAQIVFVMRATLDLLMISTLLQAIQLAGRLAQQNDAFSAKRIDVLDPFEERVVFSRIGWWLQDDGVGKQKVIELKKIADFPHYSAERLRQIVMDPKPYRDAMQRTALALAAKQAAQAGHPEQARPLLTKLALNSNRGTRELALRIALETDLTALMALARANAFEAKVAGEAININNLLEGYGPLARQLARRAIRNGLGELDVMASLPQGEFTMGAAEGEEASSDDEQPQHKVQIPAFEIGKYPVTFEEYDAFVEATGADEPGDEGWGRGPRPVINVSWHDAKAYVAWLNSWTNSSYRLPSEAEWEYACRASTSTRYWFGDNDADLDDHAWFVKNAGLRTHRVGGKIANNFGLHDMIGNVHEWVEDLHHDTYENAPCDGSAWKMGDGNFFRRVVRGGFWGARSRFLRSASRSSDDPAWRNNSTGFRLARTVIQ